MALVWIGVVGCDLKPEVVGATLPMAITETEGGGKYDSSETTLPTTPTTGGVLETEGESSHDSSETTHPTTPTTGEVSAPDGTPCLIETEYHGGPVVAVDPGCDGGVCLYATYVNFPPVCDGPEDCVGDEKFAGCTGIGRCGISTAWGEAHTTCTSTCEQDSDCAAVPGCSSGLACSEISLIGDLCCQKVCVCRDEVSQDWLDMRRQDCETWANCP